MAGFQAVRLQGASGNCGTLETYTVPSTHVAMAIGDVVKLDSTADPDGRMQVLPEAAGKIIIGSLGVVAGFIVNPSNLLTTGLSTDIKSEVRVMIDPDQVYSVEVNGTALITMVGKNADTLAALPVTNGGLTTSEFKLDVTTVPSTVKSRPWRIVGLIADSDGAFTTALVRPNASALAAGTDQVGGS